MPNDHITDPALIEAAFAADDSIETSEAEARPWKPSPSPQREAEALTAICEPIALSIAANCEVAPQLVFPHLYLGIRDLLAEQKQAGAEQRARDVVSRRRFDDCTDLLSRIMAFVPLGEELQSEVSRTLSRCQAVQANEPQSDGDWLLDFALLLKRRPDLRQITLDLLGEKRAAQAVQPDESAWLVEYDGKMLQGHPGAVNWLAIQPQGGGYGKQEMVLVSDAGRALRFARKEDAELMLKLYCPVIANKSSSPWEMYNHLTVTEHMWPSAAQPQQREAVQQIPEGYVLVKAYAECGKFADDSPGLRVDCAEKRARGAPCEKCPRRSAQPSAKADGEGE